MLTRNSHRLSVNQLEDRLAPAAQVLDLTTAGAFGGVRGAIFSQFSGTKAIKYAARHITTKPAPGTSTPAASRSACRAACAVRLKSFHAPMPPA